MSETEQAADAVVEEEAAPEGTVAVEETVEAEPEAAVEAEAAVEVEDEPVHETPEDPVAAAEAELIEEAIPVPVGASGARQAKILLCERGHRTVALWSAPTVCHARPTRSGPECGRPLYPIGELPEQVQKALNPLKASKKASKG